MGERFRVQFCAVARGLFICGLCGLVWQQSCAVAWAQITGLDTLTQVATGAYSLSDTNSCAIDHNNLISENFTTSGVQDSDEYIAYYDSSQHIHIGRRTFNSSTGIWGSWTVTSASSTGTASGTGTYTVTDASDDHNVIALGIDPNGILHMSWDMHNVTLNYAMSGASVTGTSTFGAVSNNTRYLTLAKQSSTTAPTLFPNGSATTNEVTYPEFYNVPGTGQLIFAYRNGGAGGGSGNGNQYIDAYTASANTWTNNFMINGEATSVNAYMNGFVYDSNGNLDTTWTYRASPNWQTNSNIMFAQSPDNGVSWYQQGGTTQYALPIVQNTSVGSASQVGQIVQVLPQNTSFINQTSMTVDNENRPIVATYWAPGVNNGGVTNANAAVTASNNPNLQYMLVYYTGSAWETSQITNRTSDTAFDTSGNDVRDLGRPIVLVDKQDRVLVVTRYEDTHMGSFTSSSTTNNIAVFYTTTADLDNSTPGHVPTWTKITLDNASMGNYEPTYDQNMWNTYGILDLFYEPTGLSNETTGTVSTLEWNETQFFATKGDMNDDGKVDNSDVQAMLLALQNSTSYEKTMGLTGPDLTTLGDVNRDGVFNMTDVIALENMLANGTAGGGSLGTVPEPSSMVLLALGAAAGLAMICRRRGPRLKRIG